MADSQELHNLAAEAVGRNDHTYEEFVNIKARLTDELIGDERSSRLEVSVRFGDPEQCVRMAGLVGSPELFTIQGFDSYRYAKIEVYVGDDVVQQEYFLVVSETEHHKEGSQSWTTQRIVAVLPLDADSLQWESAMRGDHPGEWLEQFTAFIQHDVAATAARAR